MRMRPNQALDRVTMSAGSRAFRWKRHWRALRHRSAVLSHRRSMKTRTCKSAALGSLFLATLLLTGCGTVMNGLVGGALATWDVNAKQKAYEREGLSKSEASRRASEDQFLEDMQKKP